MSNGLGVGEPVPLSASLGGYPVALDDATVPGKTVHEVPAGFTDLLYLQAINPNVATVSVYFTVSGPGITDPTTLDGMDRVDVSANPVGIPPTLGSDRSLPLILAAGYSAKVSATVPPSGKPVLLYGHARRNPALGSTGQGGLIQRAPAAMGTINASAWATVPYDTDMLSNPVNVTQDAANNRLSVNSPGRWFVTAYGVISATKDNSDRIINVRFWDETTGGPVTPDPWPIFVEGNANGGSWSFSNIFEVPQSLVNNPIRTELGGSTAAFAGIQLEKAGFTVIQTSPSI